ncbi:MAG: glycosyltransferase [Actinobacteria bacterium]|nr:glycosyltransferase [Actinomycetota bacterium]
MKSMDGKIALVHYWLTGMRGGEKVVESICNIYPDIDIYTLVYDEKKIIDSIKEHKIHTSFIQKLPFSKKKYQFYLPFMPVAIEQFNLSEYDIVISSESGIAKGVLTKPETCHICYCHTPMRYLWNMYFDYLENERPGLFKRNFIRMYFNYLRLWDVVSSSRVDYFVCNSYNVKKRILKYYKRDSTVIYPPVDVDDFIFTPKKQDYYLIVSQLVSYKRVDLAVRAFNRISRELIIIGEGPEIKRLKKIAGPNIKFLGWQAGETLREYYANARAFIFPGEEDFGITPVEAQASGTPVIGYGKGGLLETVVDRETGLFFYEQEVDDLIEVIERFESNSNKFDSYKIRENSLRFSRRNFEKALKKFIEEKYIEYSNNYSG